MIESQLLIFIYVLRKGPFETPQFLFRPRILSQPQAPPHFYMMHGYVALS